MLFIFERGYYSRVDYNVNIIYSYFRKTTLQIVSNCNTFIRYLTLSLLNNLFVYFQNLWEMAGEFKFEIELNLS